MRAKTWQKLLDFYNEEVPGYVVTATKESITINIGNWDGSHTVKITVHDVAKYYAQQAGSMSGCRTIAGFTSDWRGIDQIASECLEWFKFVNVEAMRRAGRSFGIEPRF
jgi:hypothetical protein